MSALLLLVLLGVVLATPVAAGWVFWDCLAGPSAQLARENARRRAAVEVGG